MACYCANFYGSINCHNQVTRFGDRCKLCIALKSGASMSSVFSPATRSRGLSPSPPAADTPSVRTRMEAAAIAVAAAGQRGATLATAGNSDSQASPRS
ncbi:hypothetical protein MCOR02_000277 [Pyricularia oryzae]|nr:hypothetical protein MCOR02_000277 [Pyricularia oryzae]